MSARARSIISLVAEMRTSTSGRVATKRDSRGISHRPEIDGIEFVEFGNQDVVRHVLVQRIVEAYKRHAEETGTQRRR